MDALRNFHKVIVSDAEAGGTLGPVAQGEWNKNNFNEKTIRLFLFYVGKIKSIFSVCSPRK